MVVWVFRYAPDAPQNLDLDQAKVDGDAVECGFVAPNYE